jgi:hypothetical protein
VPGADVAYADGTDLYPDDEEEHRKLQNWAQSAFQAASAARQPFEDRFTRFYKLYRSYVTRRKGDWHSKVFIPLSFWVVETITPRLVAGLPKMLCLPVGPEDSEPAKTMEMLLEYAQTESSLEVELVEAYKSALIYGTGILKIFHEEDVRYRGVTETAMQPVMEVRAEPVMDPETGMPLLDPDNNPVMETAEVPVMDPETGEPMQEPVLDDDGEPLTRRRREPYVVYDGPKASWVSNFDFWVAPGATTISDARYVIHKSLVDWETFEKGMKAGVYRLPEGVEPENLWTSEDNAQEKLLAEIGLQGQSEATDPARRVLELLEFWTNGRILTLANRSIIVRVQENPFDHGEKPFVRIVDHLVPGEFWGIGEIEPLEGLQDLRNAQTNLRIDNLKLVLNKMFAVDVSKLVDQRDLISRPGGAIRTSGDADPRSVLFPLEFGDVTPNAYRETEETDRVVEKVSAVTAYQTGTDSPSLADTATAVASIQEAGSTRFTHKTRLAEMTGLKPLARQFGSIIQQFWDTERTVRLVGPRGEVDFQTFTPEAIQGGLDYDIEASSSTQTETIRQQQSLSLLNTLAGYLPSGIDPMTGQPIPGAGLIALVEDVLLAFGKKDVDRYLAPEAEVMPEEAAATPEDMLAGLEELPPQEGVA